MKVGRFVISWRLILTTTLIADRVEWFRARQDALQWKEEVEILEAEITRCRRWFTKMAGVWRKLAIESQKPGYAAYAHEKADIFLRRASESLIPEPEDETELPDNVTYSKSSVLDGTGDHNVSQSG